MSNTPPTQLTRKTVTNVICPICKNHYEAGEVGLPCEATEAICSKCGTREWQKRRKACPKCGSKEMVTGKKCQGKVVGHCPTCGKQVSDQVRECTNCGQLLTYGG